MIVYPSFNILRNRLVALGKDFKISKDQVVKYRHPLIFLAYLENNFSDEWREFESEVIRALFSDYPDYVDTIVGYHSVWDMIMSYGDEIHNDILENMILAFSDFKISINWRQEIPVINTLDFLATINKGFPMVYDNIDTRNFLATYFKYNDFPVIIASISNKIKLEETEGKWYCDFDSETLEEIPEDSLYSKQMEAYSIYFNNQDKIIEEFVKGLK